MSFEVAVLRGPGGDAGVGGGEGDLGGVPPAAGREQGAATRARQRRTAAAYVPCRTHDLTCRTQTRGGRDSRARTRGQACRRCACGGRGTAAGVRPRPTSAACIPTSTITPATTPKPEPERVVGQQHAQRAAEHPGQLQHRLRAAERRGARASRAGRAASPRPGDLGQRAARRRRPARSTAAVAMPGRNAANAATATAMPTHGQDQASEWSNRWRDPIALPRNEPSPAAAPTTPMSSSCRVGSVSVCALTTNATNSVRNPVSTRTAPLPHSATSTARPIGVRSGACGGRASVARAGSPAPRPR